jgi:hypothetical protein
MIADADGEDDGRRGEKGSEMREEAERRSNPASDLPLQTQLINVESLSFVLVPQIEALDDARSWCGSTR